MAERALVLVVDDLDDNRSLYARYLTRSGFRVEGAKDGVAALARVADEKPDLIVMDLGMPGMDGWEATRRLKSDPATKDIVILVVTGRDTPESLRRAREAGADDVWIKPCLAGDLVTCVRALLPTGRRRQA